jgi:hypothetical protein
MEIVLDKPVLRACRQWLRPVARWLLRSGVAWREFSELSRKVFVDVATEEFGIRGRPTNVSRVALLTGLSRREVRRLRSDDLEPQPTDSERPLNHASRVLTGWHLDPDFTDLQGHPRTLPESGDEGSFQALLRRYAGDIPATVLTKELLRSGSMERLENGELRVLRRYYMPSKLDGRAVDRAGSVLEDLVDTVEHNLSRRTREPSRFEGRAQNAHIDPRHLPAFRAFMEREAQGFLERVDDWLSSHEVDADSCTTAPVRLGVGVYAIHDARSGGTS